MPRVEWISNLTNIINMGVSLPGCTTRNGRIRRWAIEHRKKLCGRSVGGPSPLSQWGQVHSATVVGLAVERKQRSHIENACLSLQQCPPDQSSTEVFHLS